MNYEDIWQKQDEITAAVNSLGFSLWDLHYDRDHAIPIKFCLDFSY